MIRPLCHPSRPHAAHGLCRSCYKRKHHPAPVDVASRMRAVHEADAEMEFEVFRARAEGFGSKFYDEILLRAMRRRKDAAARIDAEWPVAGEDFS
jgi:hypothetical protein